MSLVAWWPLNGDLQDKVGGNDLVATNTSVNTLNSNGKIGKTYQNTSNTAGSMISKNSFLLPSTQSMFCWIYMTSVYNSSSLNAICGQHRYQTNSGMGITIKYNNSSSGYLSVNTGNGSSRTYNTYCGSTLLSTNTWYHVGFTYDGSTIRLYVNGVLDGTHSYSGQKLYSEPFGAYMWSFNSATVGDRTPHANYCPQGRINDIRVYDHVLSITEIKELSKALVLHYTFDDTTIPSSGFIGDGSGYGRYATLQTPSAFTIVDETNRGMKAIRNISGNASARINTTLDPSFITTGTICFWYKKDSSAMNTNNGQFLVATQLSSGKYLFATGASPWSDATNFSDWYVDGVYKKDPQNKDTNWHFYCIRGVNLSTWTSFCMHAHGDTSWLYRGNISDFRIYNTNLSEADILSMYKSVKKINRKGLVEVNTYNETSVTTSCYSSKGVQKINYVSEPIQLSDGSWWLQVSHHNNKGGTVLFSSSDPFETKFVYKNENCWAAFHLIKQHGLYNSKYEFMALEQLGTGSEHILRRWSQTVSPFTATYNDVKPGSSKVTHISNMPSLNGGMYKLNSSTYFCVTNASNGNWYGAFGSWTKHGSGIPTFNNSSTAGTFDLYVRVSPDVAQKYREFKGGILMAQIDEI